MDAVAHNSPVLVSDLDARPERRWRAFTGAVLDRGVRAVFALPVTIAACPIGALDLFRYQPGPLSAQDLSGALLAAEFAALPLLDLAGADVDWADAGETDEAWTELATLERVEVYQATGMLMGQLDVGPAEALLRLRAHAFAVGQTASALAWDIVARRVTLPRDRHPDDSRRRPGDDR